MRDQDLALDAIEDAQRILTEHIEPDSHRTAETTINMLLFLLDRREVVAAVRRAPRWIWAARRDEKVQLYGCTVEFGRDVSRPSARLWTFGTALRRSSSHNAPAFPSISVGHPLRKRSTVAMPAAGNGPGPCCGDAEQQGRRQRESQDGRAAARSRQSCLRTRDDAVDATLCVSRCKARSRSYLLNEVGSIVGTDAIVAGGGQENSTCFGALGTKIHVGRPARRAKQPIEFIAQYRFCGAGICR